MATYFDSVRQLKKDYTNIKKVLVDALPGYAKSGGTIRGTIVLWFDDIFAMFNLLSFLTFRVLCSDTRCTLILLSPNYSMATYFDSDRQSNKDYTNIKKVLDDVLTGYAKSGGTFRRPICRYGKHVFTHIMTFLASSSRLAVRRMPTTPSITCGRSYGAIITFCYQIISKIGPQAWQQSRTRQEFFRIQSEFAEIIHQDVLRTSGQFYLRYQPSNSDLDTATNAG